MTTTTGGSRRRISGTTIRAIGYGAAICLLLLPLIAMRFTSEVVWTFSDFLFAGTLFAIVAAIAEVTARRSGSAFYRAGVAAGVLAGFLLVWINGAVGIIGDEDNPANLVFLVIILLAAAGAIAANFAADGMARAMALAAAVQLAVGMFVLAFGVGASEPPGAAGIFSINLFFAGLWALSAGLFRRAARDAG